MNQQFSSNIHVSALKTELHGGILITLSWHEDNTPTLLSLSWQTSWVTHLTWDKILPLHTQKTSAFLFLSYFSCQYCSSGLCNETKKISYTVFWTPQSLKPAAVFHVGSGWVMAVYPTCPKTIRKGPLPRKSQKFSFILSSCGDTDGTLVWAFHSSFLQEESLLCGFYFVLCGLLWSLVSSVHLEVYLFS